MVIVNRCYDVLKMNDAAQRLTMRLIADPIAVSAPVNAIRLLFDARLMRPFVLDWERVACALLWRVQRETLARPGDAALAAFMRDLHAYPGVQSDWQKLDFASACEPGLVVRARRDDLELGFMIVTTTFNAPQNVTLDELRIDSYFPLDERTKEACARLALTSS